MAMVITPRMGGGQNYETYWFGGGNISPITRAKSIQAQRPNNFCSASINAKNFPEGLPDEKKLYLDKSKSKIILTSWIAWIWYYIERNGMDTVFHIYNPYLKIEVYFLDELGASECGKVSKWV